MLSRGGGLLGSMVADKFWNFIKIIIPRQGEKSTVDERQGRGVFWHFALCKIFNFDQNSTLNHLKHNFEILEQLNHNNDKFMSKRPHKWPGVMGRRGGGLWLNIKEVGFDGRWGGAFSQFSGYKFWDLTKLKKFND